MKLYVGNLCYTMTETELGSLFIPHGSILKVNLIRDHWIFHIRDEKISVSIRGRPANLGVAYTGQAL